MADSPDKTDTANENRPQVAMLPNNTGTSLEFNAIKETEDVSKDYTRKITTIMDEPLSQIIDKTLNFLTYSVDSYSTQYNKAAVLLDQENHNSWFGRLKISLYAIILFITHEEQILYIGILCILVSIIIYFINITTS